MNFDDIKFKSLITVAEKANLVTRIVNSLFNGDDYLPEIFEDQFWIHVADAYSDIDESIECTADEFMDALYTGGLKRRIENSVNQSQLSAVRNAVEKRIEMRLARKPADDFYEMATSLLKKVEAVVDVLDLKSAIDSISKLDVDDFSKEVASVLAKNIDNREKDVKE